MTGNSDVAQNANKDDEWNGAWDADAGDDWEGDGNESGNCEGCGEDEWAAGGAEDGTNWWKTEAWGWGHKEGEEDGEEEGGGNFEEDLEEEEPEAGSKASQARGDDAMKQLWPSSEEACRVRLVRVGDWRAG